MSSAAAFLNDREPGWRRLLRGISLVAEADAPEVEVRQALRCLGLAYVNTAEYSRDMVMRRYPACLLLGLTHVGATGYEHGAFWPGVWTAVGIDGDAFDASRWGTYFRSALEQCRLARFTGLPQINVSEILIHAGVPDYCLGDLLQLLAKRQERDPGLNAQQFLEWVLDPGYPSRLLPLDKPARRFLQHGGAYAEDYLDRCLDLLARLSLPAFDPDGLHLPTKVVTTATDLVQTGAIALTTSSSPGGPAATLRARPRIILEPFGRGVLLWLPPIDDAPQGTATWQLWLDGDPQTVISRAPWSGDREPAPALAVPITRPVRQVTASLVGTDREHTVAVVDPTDPLLIFTADGTRMSPTTPLAPEPVWLLHPAPSTDVPDVIFDGAAAVTDECPPPYGWPGWLLRQVDLCNVRKVRSAPDARPRTVHGRRRPRLLLDHPVAGVTGAGGGPVHGRVPIVVLPGDVDTSVRWSVQIRRSGVPGNLAAVTYQHDEQVAVAPAQITIDPWRRVPRPAVGSFEIVVRGPLGRGLTQTVELAEGLAVTVDPPLRELGANGLATGHIEVRGAGLTVVPPTAHLTPSQASVRIAVRGADQEQTLTVTPPHMAVRHQCPGEASTWSLRPLRLDTEALTAGHLEVRWPEPGAGELLVQVGTATAQAVDPVAGTPGITRFSLARIADTVAASGSARLVLTSGEQQWTVARCAPRRLARAVRVDDAGAVVVQADQVTTGLVAGVYQVLMPWRAPTVVAVPATGVSAPLAPDLVQHGPLQVHLRVDDPWLPEPWPDWPPADNTFPVDRPATGLATTDGDHILAAFLAGQDLDLERGTDPTVVHPALVTYALAKRLRRAGVSVDIRHGVSRLLAQHPRVALQTVLDARLAPTAVTAPLVQAGLVALPPVAYLDPDAELALWAVHPVAAIVACAHRLLRADPPAQLVETVVATCGNVAADLIGGGSDRFAAVGKFDSAEVFAALPPEQVDRLWRAARIVPGGLLDDGERLVAARELFDARLRTGARGLAADGGALLRLLRPLIAEFGGDRCAATVAARRAGDSWVALPELSIALAMAARLAARGCRPLREALSTRYGRYAQLARCAPRLTAIDLVRAELIIAGA